MPNVAHALVRTMADAGVNRIFLNPGTDTAPIQEALAELDGPRVVLCLHEAVALAAAHAYFAVTGRPQVVMVHVDVGTQNLGSMMHNASRANAGVVVIAGRTPLTAYGELPGGRDTGVHWMQDVPDQAGVVRPSVKWAADLTEPATATRLLARALQVAGSAPTGPVYLTVPREVLMAPGPDPFDASRFGPSVAPAPDPTALARAADVLAGSVRPVIVTSRIGQRTTAVAELVELVDTLGASVVETRERMNFPSSHPAYQRETTDADAALRSADAVLVVDCPIPWIPASVTPPDDAIVISMELDPVWTAMPHWSYPVDLPIQCDPESGVRELRKALQDRKIEPRGWRARSTPAGRGDVLDVADALNELLSPDDIVVEEAVTNAEPLRARLDREIPGTYLKSGGSGLGWGLGATLGVKLAAPDRRVVTIVGDGSFVFGAPTAALSALTTHRAPALVVVLRNGGYAASREPVYRLFPQTQGGDVVGTLFPDVPDVALLARACGGYGEHVSDTAKLRPALRRALDVVDQGQAAVVSVAVGSPFIPPSR